LSSDALDTIRTLAAGPIAEASVDAIQAFIQDLEKELQNLEFRLQYFYHHRNLTLDAVATAKRQLERLKG